MLALHLDSLASDLTPWPEDEMIKRHTQTGTPLGSAEFVKQFEALTGKSLAPRKPGRKANRGK
jgi:putative transposase